MAAVNDSNCDASAVEPPDAVLLRQAAYGVALPAITATGLTLNSLVLIVLLSRRSTSINSVALHYLFSLILSNLILMILSVPWLLDRARDPAKQCPPHSYAFYHAHFELPLLNICATFSLYVLVCMSFERYLSVCRPALFRRFHRPSTARLVLASSALCALALQAPLGVGEGVNSCSIDCWNHIESTDVTATPYWLAYVSTCQILTRFLPSAFIIGLNIRMMIQFRRLITKRSLMTTNAVSVSQLNTPSSSHLNLSVQVSLPPTASKTLKTYHANKDERRLMLLLALVIALVLFCIIPSGVASILVASSVPSAVGKRPVYFMAVANGLELAHYAVIAIVFCFCNNDIRRRLGLMIQCNLSSSSSHRRQDSFN